MLNTNAGTQMLKHSAETELEHRSWNTDAGTQMLEHRCWNTNAGTQMLKHSAETELEHRSWNTDAGTQMIGWLVMEHAQENWQKKLDDDRGNGEDRRDPFGIPVQPSPMVIFADKNARLSHGHD
jgi:primosomal replication protein N